jgi:hypothetical protein
MGEAACCGSLLLSGWCLEGRMVALSTALFVNEIANEIQAEKTSAKAALL